MANYTILLIDYDPRGVERMRAPLEEAGFRVETAADGAAGLEAFEKLRPNVTLIEPMLPKVHGFEVCKQIKATEHGKAAGVVIATSVYRGRRYQNQATLQYGADAYLEKPVADDLLLQTVRKLVADQSPLVSAAPDQSKPPIETEVQVPLQAPQTAASPLEEPMAPAEIPVAVAAPAKARPAESLETEIDNALDDLF